MPITPMLYYPEIEPALAFYTGVLGFETTWLATDEHTGKAQHAELLFESGALMLDRLADPNLDSPLGAGLVLYIETHGDIDAKYRQLRAAGVEIVEPLADQPWGHRTFSINDPAGYALTFAKPLYD